MHIVYSPYIHHVSHDMLHQLVHLRVLFEHLYGVEEISSSGTAAAKYPEALFQYHPGVHRNRVFRNSQEAYGSFRSYIVDDLVDGLRRAVSAHAFKGVIYDHIVGDRSHIEGPVGK